MEIRLVHREFLDAGKWDRVVAASPGETLYPYSWYLDSVGETWSALVMDDYRYIMALPWKRKYGIPYFYQPIICQQLGVLGPEFPDSQIVSDFIAHLPGSFRFGTLQFNSGNPVEGSGKFRVRERNNHILPLAGSYEQISGAYSQNTRRNLKRALASGSDLDQELDLAELMDLKSGVDRPRRSRSWYMQVNRQLQAVLDHGEGRIMGIRETGRLKAAVFIAFTRNRMISLMPVSSDEGKEERAMFRIVDQLVREKAGSGITLDFEGSDIPGIARFFAGFGATPEKYYALDIRRFPFSWRRRGGHE